MYEINDNEILFVEYIVTSTQKTKIKTHHCIVNEITLNNELDKIVIGLTHRKLIGNDILEEQVDFPEEVCVNVEIENDFHETVLCKLKPSIDNVIDISAYSGYGKVKVIVANEHMGEAILEVVL